MTRLLSKSLMESNNVFKHPIHPHDQVSYSVGWRLSCILHLIGIQHSLLDMFCLMDYGVNVVF